MALDSTTLRDFSGGWNTSDDPKALKSQYQTVARNVDHALDGSIVVRYGRRQFATFEGTETAASPSVTFATTNTSPKVVVNWTGHGMVAGDHVTISGVASAINGIPAAEFNITHAIRYIDANSFEICTRSAASSTATTGSTAITAVKDTHEIGGNIIDMRFFQNHTLLFSTTGEIASIDSAGTKTLIWGPDQAYALSGNPDPWRELERVSFDVMKDQLIVCNGRTRDKPIRIDFNQSTIVDFLYEPATTSNSHITPCDFVKAHARFFMLVSTSNSPTEVRISDVDAPGVYTGVGSPGLAIDIELSAHTESVDSTITGVGSNRNQLFFEFVDGAIVGQIGILNSSGVHTPDFGDVIEEHGTFSHRTIQSTGNDLFMCDYIGVTSVQISKVSGLFVPAYMNELVRKDLQVNIARLEEEQLTNDVFALWDGREKKYMLFLPKYGTGESYSGSVVPIQTTAALAGFGQAYITIPNSNFYKGDSITIAGAVDVGALTAANINGSREIIEVIDESNYIIEVGGVYASQNVSGGGTSVTATAQDSGKHCFVFENNSRMKIQRWKLWDGRIDFDCGCVTARRRVLFAKERVVYEMGTNTTPIYSDDDNVYDQTWTAGAVTAGTRVYDSSTEIIWEVQQDFTIPSATTVDDYLADNPDDMHVYRGLPISFEWETPWGDFNERTRTKQISYLSLDTAGQGTYTVTGFADSDDANLTTLSELEASQTVADHYTSLTFVGEDKGGFGSSRSTFGGSKNTVQELLNEFPVSGMLIKLRFEGQTTEPLRFVAVSLHYTLGTYWR